MGVKQRAWLSVDELTFSGLAERNIAARTAYEVSPGNMSELGNSYSTIAQLI